MSNNNPFIHTEYIEIVTAEDLAEGQPASSRANKVVATNESGVIPEQLIPTTLSVSSLKVSGVTLTGDVELLTSGTISLTPDNLTNPMTITLENTAISSINGIAGEVTLVPNNNIFLSTVDDQIIISDDLIKVPETSEDIAEIKQEYEVDGQGRIVEVRTFQKFFLGSFTLFKTVNFTYDDRGRLEEEIITFTTTQITKVFIYPDPLVNPELPEDVPISWTKSISSLP